MNKLLHWTDGGNGVTNFNIEDLEIYTGSIELYENDILYIGEPMPPLYGSEKYLALRLKSDAGDLSGFWKIFNNIKAKRKHNLSHRFLVELKYELDGIFHRCIKEIESEVEK